MTTRPKKTAPGQSSPKRRRIQFAFPGPGASEAYLSGDFNRWHLTSHPMKKGEDGVWKKILMLPAGRYEYKFRVDGEWIEDPANGHRVLNEFGSFNCVIHVS